MHAESESGSEFMMEMVLEGAVIVVCVVYFLADGVGWSNHYDEW